MAQGLRIDVIKSKTTALFDWLVSRSKALAKISSAFDAAMLWI